MLNYGAVYVLMLLYDLFIWELFAQSRFCNSKVWVPHVHQIFQYIEEKNKNELFEHTVEHISTYNWQ